MLKNFSTHEEAYHRLIYCLASWQQKSLELILSDNVKSIFISGGFTQNDIFLHLLASFNRSIDVFVSNVSRASALGAALVINDSWNETHPDFHFLEEKHIRPLAFQIDPLLLNQ